jgi:single-strand DNA-binding protein
MHQVIFSGVLGKDAHKNTFANDKTCVNLSVAVSDDYKDAQGNWQQRTIWYDCAVFRDFDVSRYTKGSKVLCSGIPRMKDYTTPEGIVKYKMTATLASVEIIHSTSNQGQLQQHQNQPQAQQPQQQQAQGASDEPPF